MPSKKQYDLVADDSYDSRIPLHNEEAFQHGIEFQAKYIGTLDVPRPSSRVEIVAAMRRIRYEFKAKAIKKKKVDIVVGTDGVKVTLKKKRKARTSWGRDDVTPLVMHHPIYRIFYVSHDSQDLKIFSYIARDGSTNVFKCNVFKACKKAAGDGADEDDVCGMAATGSDKSDEDEPRVNRRRSTISAEQTSLMTAVESGCQSPIPPEANSSTSAVTQNEVMLQAAAQYIKDQAVDIYSGSMNNAEMLNGDYGTLSLTRIHQVQFLKQQLEQQHQQSKMLAAQLQLLKDQLAAETAARVEAQAHTHQLMLQNRELLEHINQLVGRLHDMEVRAENKRQIISDHSAPHSGHMQSLPDVPSHSSSARVMNDFDVNDVITNATDLSEHELQNGSIPGACRLRKNELSLDLDVLLNNNANEFMEKQNSRETSSDSQFDKHSLYRRLNSNQKIITPLPSMDASGNRIELKSSSSQYKPPTMIFSPMSTFSETDASANESDLFSPSSTCSAPADISLSNGNQKHTELSRLSWLVDEKSKVKQKGITLLMEDEETLQSSFLNKRGEETAENELIIREDASPLSLPKKHPARRGFYSDDENTSSQGSADSGVPRPPRRIDSMTFDEFDALCN